MIKRKGKYNKCKFCSKEFYVRPKRKGSYCSMSCLKMDCGKHINCLVCEKVFRVNRCNTTAKYCSYPCKYKGVKKDSSLPVGVSTAHHGYIAVNVNGRRSYMHRIVMEKHLGRKLKRKEVIHHINGIKSDNRLENLELIKDNGKHRKEHHANSKRDKLGRYVK